MIVNAAARASGDRWYCGGFFFLNSKEGNLKNVGNRQPLTSILGKMNSMEVRVYRFPTIFNISSFVTEQKNGLQVEGEQMIELKFWGYYPSKILVRINKLVI